MLKPGRTPAQAQEQPVALGAPVVAQQGRLVVEINKVLDAIAEAEKFDLIVQQAIFASNAINLTDRVIKELAKRTATAR